MIESSIMTDKNEIFHETYLAQQSLWEQIRIQDNLGCAWIDKMPLEMENFVILIN